MGRRRGSVLIVSPSSTYEELLESPPSPSARAMTIRAPHGQAGRRVGGSSASFYSHSLSCMPCIAIKQACARRECNWGEWGKRATKGSKWQRHGVARSQTPSASSSKHASSLAITTPSIATRTTSCRSKLNFAGAAILKHALLPR